MRRVLTVGLSYTGDKIEGVDIENLGLCQPDVYNERAAYPLYEYDTIIINPESYTHFLFGQAGEFSNEVPVYVRTALGCRRSRRLNTSSEVEPFRAAIGALYAEVVPIRRDAGGCRHNAQSAVDRCKAAGALISSPLIATALGGDTRVDHSASWARAPVLQVPFRGINGPPRKKRVPPNYSTSTCTPVYCTRPS